MKRGHRKAKLKRSKKRSSPWVFVGIYGTRRTAESVADVTREQETCETRIVYRNGNHVVEKRFVL